MSTLADRLRWILQNREFNAHSLSLAAGLAGGHVGLMISGKAGKRPADETIRKIAEAGKVDARWLGTGEGSPDPARPIRIEHEPFERIPDDVESPLEMGLFRAMDPDEFTPGDFDAVRKAIRETAPLLNDVTDLVAMAESWLRAARALRVRDIAVTTTAITTFVAVGKTARAKEVAAEVDENFRAEAGESATAMGGAPGKHGHVAERIVKNAKKRRSGDS